MVDDRNLAVNNRNSTKRFEMKSLQMENTIVGGPMGMFGMRKYRLTGLFLVIASLIFIGVAIAINVTTTKSEEKQIVQATTTESIKDAKVVAGVVTDLLDAAGTSTEFASSKIPGTASSINIVEFLTDSEIIGLNLYLPDGTVAWSSVVGRPGIETRQREIFMNSLGGAIASGLIRGSTIVGISGAAYLADVVETYVPISDFETGEPALILGVTRDVTVALSTSIEQSRSAVLQSTMISLGTGFIVMLIAVFIVDIRMWKQRKLAAEHDRKLASHELSVSKLNMANRDLRQVNDERQKILSTVSHELKTPLTSIIAFTDILSRHQSGKKTARNLEHLKIVKRSGDHLLSLINDLLSSNGSRSSGTAIQREEFDVADMLRELEETMNPILEAKQQTLAIEGVSDPQMVNLDRRRILQAMMNLVSNSSKFSRDDSVILLESRIEAHDLKIFVADPGIGMSKEKLRQLFDLDLVQDAAANGNGGNGLGLRIVKDIVESHGGRIYIQSQPGQGTRVSIVLPIGEDEE